MSVRRATLLCTDRGRHRVTVLYVIRYHADVAPSESVVQWTPTLPGSWFEPGPCPRCGRNPRFSHRATQHILTDLEQWTRDAQGRASLDISHLPI